jgi:hypothetical protein
VGTTKVDLKEGRPQDDVKRMEAEEAEAVAAAEDAKKNKKSKASKTKKAKKAKKVEKGPDFGNLSTKANDDLIIY